MIDELTSIPVGFYVIGFFVGFITTWSDFYWLLDLLGFVGLIAACVVGLNLSNKYQ